MVHIHLIPTLHFREKKRGFVSVSIWSHRFLNIMSVEEKKVDIPSQEELQEALDQTKKAYDIMKKQALDVRKEKEAFDSVAEAQTCPLRFRPQVKRGRYGIHYQPSNTDKRYWINASRHVFWKI